MKRTVKAKTLIKRIGIMSLVCLIAAGLCACGGKKRSRGRIDEEMDVYHGTYGDEAADK